jgi:peptidoglycan/LPS O-acetylase OafA/YrhL
MLNHPVKLPYRAELDGLRAVAVVSVILYHAQFLFLQKDWFEGGFIGVDIFFVISGYLITRIILSELSDKNTFSFMNFYERRARRILPMLFLVIFVSIPFAWQRLLPSDLDEFFQSILSSIFFGSNFLFYFSMAEYGADSALLKPLLHTWSLAVEEQFYLVFPIIALVAYKYFRTHFLTLLIGLSLLSLLFAVVMETRDSDLNFYLPFSRFWEIAVGSLLAYRELTQRDKREVFWAKFLPIIGLCLIVYSILFFDSTTPHPSLYTLIPIFGTAFIIGFSTRDEWIGRALGSKPLVWIGLISYSAYLWHFPIFALSRYSDVSIGNYDKLGWIVLTFLLAFISFRLIERPFRNGSWVSAKFFLMLFLFITVLLSIISFFVISNNGYVDRLKGTVGYHMNTVEWLKLRKPNVTPINKVGENYDKPKSNTSCYKRVPSEGCIFSSVEVITLGDSFVGAIEPTLLDRLNSRGIGLQTLQFPGCAYLSASYDLNSQKNQCVSINRAREEYFQTLTGEKIFIIFHAIDDHGSFSFLRSQHKGNSIKAKFKDHFSLVGKLIGKGHKVVVLYGIPRRRILDSRKLFQKFVTSQYLGGDAFGKDTYSDVTKRTHKFTDALNSINDSNLISINLAEVLCESEGSRRCYDLRNGTGPIYNNGQHLSRYGASLVVDRVLSELNL